MLVFHFLPEPVYNSCTKRNPVAETLMQRRRPSRLSAWLAGKKIEEARRMTAEERLLLAFELSDFCFALNHPCSEKR